MTSRRQENRSKKSTVFNIKLCLNYYLKNILDHAKDPKYLDWFARIFIIIEIFINILVIERVNYTEIDWKAYMQEVEGFLNGTFDYSELKGDTGPLVYPAGFVYIFSILYYLTSAGTNIKLAQYIFAFIHIILLYLVLRIYSRTKKVPPWVLIFMFSTSYRVHSIFVLRLFNDPIAMLILYASINAFLDQYWHLGSILFSLAVSVKMNILLFAPALLIAYLTNLGFTNTLIHLSICALVQLILGLPFLTANPVSYITGSFNMGRVFEFKWTVNWRFLSEKIFVDPSFHIFLLSFHLMLLLYFIPKWKKYFAAYNKLTHIQNDLKPQFDKKVNVDMSTKSQLFILPLFMANFIGIACSRSLHYQFYVWYYHTLPYLTWCCTSYKDVIRLAILGIIELCWNTYPSTVFSSISLHLCHIFILYGLKKNIEVSLKTA